MSVLALAAARCPTCGVESEETAEYVNHFRLRVLQDAIAEGTAAHWLRRAEAFAGVGNKRCDEIAQACLRAAAVARWKDYP